MPIGHRPKNGKFRLEFVTVIPRKQKANPAHPYKLLVVLSLLWHKPKLHTHLCPYCCYIEKKKLHVSTQCVQA